MAGGGGAPPPPPPDPHHLAVEFFNGSPEQGQNVGIVTGDLTSMTVDSLGWNGAAFTWIDIEEADVACTGPLVTSDVCVGLRHKIAAGEIYDVLFVVLLLAFVPTIAFNSWLVHQLRFGLVEQTQDKATVGYYGCVTANAAWWLDPCTYIILLLVAFVSSLLVGVPAYPIAMSLALDNFIGLSGLWWGGAQTIFGAQARLTMAPGYELFCVAMLLALGSALATYKLRDEYRKFVYGGGIDSSEDATKFGEALMEGLGNRVRGMTGVLNYVPNLQWGAGEGGAGGGGPAGAAPGSGAGREYSKSTLDQMIPSEQEFGVQHEHASTFSAGGGKEGAAPPPPEPPGAPFDGGADDNAFAPSKGL